MSSDYEFSDNEYYDEDEDAMLEDDGMRSRGGELGGGIGGGEQGGGGGGVNEGGGGGEDSR